MLAAAIDSYLRNHVTRGSSLWKALSTSKAIVTRYYRVNPINTRRWAANQNTFENVVERYSRDTKEFFVLQIGACDGQMDDPIYQYVKKYKWRGLLVEPQKKAFEQLRIAYKDQGDNLRFENAAISDKDDLRPLYKIRDDAIDADWKQGVASLISKPGADWGPMDIEMVQCLTFDTLFNRHEVGRIDLLQIDVEGYDYEILKLLDIGKVKPRLIRYEHCLLSSTDRDSCKRYLAHNGYKLFEMQIDTGAVLWHDH